MKVSKTLKSALSMSLIFLILTSAVVHCQAPGSASGAGARTTNNQGLSKDNEGSDAGFSANARKVPHKKNLRKAKKWIKTLTLLKSTLKQLKTELKEKDKGRLLRLATVVNEANKYE